MYDKKIDTCTAGNEFLITIAKVIIANSVSKRKTESKIKNLVCLSDCNSFFCALGRATIKGIIPVAIEVKYRM